MIIVAGSLSFDFVMNFPGKFADHIMPEKIHVLNLSFLAQKLNKNFGGTAGNIAYNLVLLGGFYAGAMAKAANLSLKEIKEAIDFVIISPTTPKAMVKFAKECQQLNIPYLFDPGMQLPRLTKNELLKGSTIETKDKIIMVGAAVPKNTSDPVGAGDA